MADRSPKRVDYARARRLATERRRRDRRRLRAGRAPIGRPRHISVFARLMGDLAPVFAHFAAAVAGADKAVGDSMRALAAAMEPPPARMYSVSHWNPATIGTLRTFVRAHGLDPNDVPIPCDITVADGQVTFERFVRGADGRLALVDGEVQRDSVTVGQVASWPFPEGTDL